LEGAGDGRWRGLVEKTADARSLILAGLRAGVGGVRAAEPAQSGTRMPTETLPSSLLDRGLNAGAQRIFANLPGGRRKPMVRRDPGVHLRARGKMNGRLLRTGLDEAR
jgi:hypothetical protein